MKGKIYKEAVRKKLYNMKIRQKFEFCNFISIAAPIAIIGVVSVVFLIIFVLKFPVEQLYITRAALLNPALLIRAVGSFFRDNPMAVTYTVIYIIFCITVCAVTNTIVTKRLAASLETPLRELRSNVDAIRGGSLRFEVMGNDYDEVNDLCEGVDAMRRALLLSQLREKKLKHEQNMLIANISHDLKTPITSIRGYIDGINDGIADTPEKLKKYLSTIKSKADIIDNLVSNLSTFAQLEAPGLRLNMSIGDLRDLILDICDGFTLDFERCGIELKTDLGTEPVPVKIDGEMMKRVFSNLIDNSVKYRSGENSSISIRCFTENKNAYVTVTDNGIGIEPRELRLVFDSFYRADSSRSSRIKGNGLGLGIAKNITEKHGGRLWIRSDGPGCGTCATVCLPLAK